MSVAPTTRADSRLLASDIYIGISRGLNIGRILTGVDRLRDATLRRRSFFPAFEIGFGPSSNDRGKYCGANSAKDNVPVLGYIFHILYSRLYANMFGKSPASSSQEINSGHNSQNIQTAGGDVNIHYDAPRRAPDIIVRPTAEQIARYDPNIQSVMEQARRAFHSTRGGIFTLALLVVFGGMFALYRFGQDDERLASAPPTDETTTGVPAHPVEPVEPHPEPKSEVAHRIHSSPPPESTANDLWTGRYPIGPKADPIRFCLDISKPYVTGPHQIWVQASDNARFVCYLRTHEPWWPGVPVEGR